MRVQPINISSDRDLVWSTVSDDPQFIISFSIMRPFALTIFAHSAQGQLDPVLYVDRGAGFREEDSWDLPHTGPTVYVVPLYELPEVKRLRFDPATQPCSLQLSIIGRYWRGSVPSLVGSALKRAGMPDSATVKCIIPEIPPKRGLLSSLKKKLTERRFIDHYGHVTGLAAAAQSRSTAAATTISLVVPTYNTPLRFLNDLLSSVRQQSIPVELIFSDDGSQSGETRQFLQDIPTSDYIQVVQNSANEGISAATNRGISRARGSWVGLMDHDDALAPHALERVVKAMQDNRSAEFLYTDEILTDSDLKPFDYLLKPAYDPVLLSGVNYINHLSFYRRERLIGLGGLRPGFEGSQDYDLLLRYLRDLDESTVVHLPYPAYLWRRGMASYSTTHLDRSLVNARKALSEHFGDDNLHVRVDPAEDLSRHRVRFDVDRHNWPEINIVIPNRDSYALISRLLNDLRRKTDYPCYRIIVVDNGSEDTRVINLYNRLQREEENFLFEVKPHPFNFSRQVNRGMQLANHGHVLLLNNDVEVISADWLKEMVSCLMYTGVGIVGAKLLYPNRTLQHAGVIVGLGGLAGHWFGGMPADFPGPFGRLQVRQTLSAVTGACMLISRECLEVVGLFDQEQFSVAYNDVDYCLRASMLGYRTVWTPFATLIHHESLSRGPDTNPKNRARFQREKEALRRRHTTETYIDPAFSPWYTRDRTVPGLSFLTGLPAARTIDRRRAPYFKD